MKTCSRCKIERSEENFRVDRGYVRGVCRDCEAELQRLDYWNHPERGRAASRKWSRENPEKRNAAKRAWHHKNKSRINLARRVKAYGLTVEKYKQMLEKQHNCCACCHTEFQGTPEIDHCHKTGAVRGLLCLACNTGLGLFQDSDIALLQAISYLKKFQG